MVNWYGDTPEIQNTDPGSKRETKRTLSNTASPQIGLGAAMRRVRVLYDDFFVAY